MSGFRSEITRVVGLLIAQHRAAALPRGVSFAYANELHRRLIEKAALRSRAHVEAAEEEREMIWIVRYMRCGFGRWPTAPMVTTRGSRAGARLINELLAEVELAWDHAGWFLLPEPIRLGDLALRQRAEERTVR